MLQPELASLLHQGGEFTLARQFDEAAALYLQAVQLAPASPEVWSHLGVLYAVLRQEVQTEACYRRAIQLNPHYAKARFNLGCLLLRQGHFDEGWAGLEARDWYAELAARLPCPRWQGEPLQGKAVLIGFEAGHGDMIQMVRYAAVLKARGAARLTLLCHPALKRLFCSLAAVDVVVGFDEPLPCGAWDVWTPPFSLPHHCQTRLDTVPAQLPYLHAPAALARQWAQRLDSVAPPLKRVGLAWRGNPHFGNDAERSLPGLTLLAPLGAVSGVCWVSLQKGAGEDEALTPPAGLPMLPLGAQVHDFVELAALVMALDLVITVDTAVAHLAGALAKPVWVLLPHHLTDWRWLDNRVDSPWYPGVMRLFRQGAERDWAPVVAQVHQALRERWPELHDTTI